MRKTLQPPCIHFIGQWMVLGNPINTLFKSLIMESKILTRYKYASDGNLLSIIHRVLGKMDSNVHFPQPPAALDKLKSALPEFIAALNNASNGDQEKVAIKKTKKAVIISLLTELAEYVSLTCQGDRAQLLSSGFALTKEKGDISMSDIKEVQLTADRPGEATIRIKRVAGARAYIHQYTIDPVTSDSQWTSKVVTEASHTFSGLQSKERYLFRVIAVGVKGQEVISPSVARVIQ